MTTPLTVFERWTDRDGVPLFADRKWPMDDIGFSSDGTWCYRIRAEIDEFGERRTVQHGTDPAEINALCRAKAVEELMADGWCLEPLPFSGEYLLRNVKRPDNGVTWGANLDDALAEALRKVNAKPPLERNTPNAD